MRVMLDRPVRLARIISAGCLFGASVVTGWTRADEGAVPITRDFTVRVWRKEHGLPDNRVLCLLPARNGFLWAGTRRGLVRFDGRRFVTLSRSTHLIFRSEECTSLTEAADGTLWVGTTEGLVHLSAQPERFKLDEILLPGDDPPRQPYSEIVTRVAAGPGGRLVVATRTGAVSRRTDGAWERLELDDPSGKRTYCPTVLQDREGGWWLGTTYQLFHQASPEAPWEPEFPGQTGSDTHFVQDLALAPDGGLWAAIGNWPNQNGWLLQRVGAGWDRVSETPLRNDGNGVWLFVDSAGALWHPDDGHVLARRVGDQITRYTLPMFRENDVPSCMAEDAEGNLWLGGYQSGLVGLHPRTVLMLSVEDGLPSDSCWTLLEASDGALWVGTESGVSRWVTVDGDLLRADRIAETPSIRALAEDREGRVWMGSGTGLQVWDRGNTHAVSFEGPWWHTKVRCVRAASDGSVWVGSAAGLHRVQDREVRSWFAPEDLPHDDIRVILEDRSGQIWIGSQGGGLTRFDGRQFEHFGESEGLNSLNVWALHEATDGTLWIGTDRGLHWLRQGQIGAITTDHGLPDNLVNGIAEDDSGRLWVGHDRGIYAVSRHDLAEVTNGRALRVRCVALDEEDGLSQLETNGQKSYPPGIRLRDGRIAFATEGGVALINTSPRFEPTNGPPVQIEHLRAGGVLLFESHPGTTHPTALERGSPPMRIPASQNRAVEVAFTACSFHGADPTHFRYRLLGLTREWADSGSLRQTSFASLRPGGYVFEVQAANKHGLWSEPPERLAFRIEPHFHERSSVRFGGALLLILAVFSGVKWRLNELRRLQHLEAQAARAQERARLAKDLHDGLGAKLTELTLLGEGHEEAVTAEEVSLRFRQLGERTQAAMRSLRDLIWTANPKADTLEGLVSRVCDQAESALAAARIGCRFEIPSELPHRAVGPQFRREVLLACNEAVHNVVRHAHARQVRIRFGLESGRLAIRVEDNGCGFEVGSARASAGTGEGGLGLESLAQRMQAVRGHCDIESRPGQGTSVTLSIPL